jgi:hypothetical protein
MFEIVLFILPFPPFHIIFPLLLDTHREHFNWLNWIIIARWNLRDFDDQRIIINHFTKHGMRGFGRTIEPIQEAIVCLDEGSKNIK